MCTRFYDRNILGQLSNVKTTNNRTYGKSLCQFGNKALKRLDSLAFYVLGGTHQVGRNGTLQVGCKIPIIGALGVQVR